jgi:hypothetical protein
MMFEGDGQVGGRHRLAPPIGAITAARHVASIPRPIPEDVSADVARMNAKLSTAIACAGVPRKAGVPRT